MRSKFGLNDNVFKNEIWGHLLKEKTHSPENSIIIQKQKEFFSLAAKEAKKEDFSYIEPYHLLKGVFLGEKNIF